MGRDVTYPPLDTPKPFGPEIWIVDGPAISFYGMPFSTRMTVVRLPGGGLWLHSPVRFSDALLERVEALGPIRAFVAPNWIHYASLPDWQAARPDVPTWAAPRVAKRAKSRKVAVRIDHELSEGEDPWAGEIDMRLVTGSRFHIEAVFFHRASKVLILTDLIENFEPRKLPWWFALFARIGRMTAPDGRMPPDMLRTFWGHRDTLRGHIGWMLAQAPEKVIVAHGLCYERDAVARLRHAFAPALAEK